MYHSQEWTAQDKFVAETLKFKKNGTFLDIGCHHYKNISNTYYLESELNWSGIGIDLQCHFEQGWIQNRPNSKFICTDAATLDYKQLLQKNNMPKVIDYLTVDIDPPVQTFKALLRLFETDYIFNVVTFETDYYREKNTRDISRQIFKERGYVFIKELYNQDDFYIHSSILPQVTIE